MAYLGYSGDQNNRHSNSRNICMPDNVQSGIGMDISILEAILNEIFQNWAWRLFENGTWACWYSIGDLKTKHKIVTLCFDSLAIRLGHLPLIWIPNKLWRCVAILAIFLPELPKNLATFLIIFRSGKILNFDHLKR